MTTPPKFSDVYAELLAGVISPPTVRSVFDAIFAGAWTPVQIAGFATTVRARNQENAATITAAAEALRAAMVPIHHGLPQVVDTCGTGGDGLGTVNISTGAAIIVAAAGLPVAKHGNRAASSLTGSADVLEALGIPVDLPPAAATRVLAEAGITFLFAPTHHPAMRHAGQARKELGIRTIFNCLGPLANPAGATHQLVGAPDEPLRPVLAEALRTLGSRRAWVVRGTDGLDEMSPCAPTRVSEMDASGVRELELSPEDFGLERIPLTALRGGNAAENAQVLEQVLAGEAHPARNGFLLNAAAALVVADAGLSLRDAAARARELVRSGAARQVLTRWRAAATAARADAT